MNEFSALMRPPSLPHASPEVEAFLWDLTGQLRTEIRQQLGPVPSTVTDMISSQFDISLVDLRALLDDAKGQRAQRRVAFVHDLQVLHNQLCAFAAEFRAGTKALVKQVEAEANNLVYVEAARKAKMLSLETEWRELTLAKMDLEARVGRQTRDWENVHNDLFQLELKKREFVKTGEASPGKGIPSYDAVARELRILEEQLREDQLSPMLKRMNETVACETKALQDEIGAVLRLPVKRGTKREAHQGQSPNDV
jgi:hypothetical protein